MKQKKCKQLVPHYRGKKWIQPSLPKKCESWVFGRHRSAGNAGLSAARLEMLRQLRTEVPWQGPKRPLNFITDLHADTDAFLASAVATGILRKTGSKDKDFKLTKANRDGAILIGGDCFDKGPGLLRLLRSIRSVAERGAKLSLLAGNHDIRVMLGLRAIGMQRALRNEHFFLRLGPKVIPLLLEVSKEYLNRPNTTKGLPSNETCRQLLFPSPAWIDQFPLLAAWTLSADTVEHELRRLQEKAIQFEQDREAAGLSMQLVYAAALKCREIFLHPQGEFGWYFRDMKLAQRHGTFLFIHAGVDDRIAAVIADSGVAYLNQLFKLHSQADPFEFYYGALANTIRTKYRPVDKPLTAHGVAMLNRAGIQAVVNGHRKLLHGQRIMLRKGIVNFECDTSLDRNTRVREGLSGYGASVTIFRPEGRVLGICNDYPRVKVFNPEKMNRMLREVKKSRHRNRKMKKG